MELELCDGRVQARVVRAQEHRSLEVELRAEGAVDELIEQAGEIPLPPYIRRAASELHALSHCSRGAPAVASVALRPAFTSPRTA